MRLKIVGEEVSPKMCLGDRTFIVRLGQTNNPLEKKCTFLSKRKENIFHSLETKFKRRKKILIFHQSICYKPNRGRWLVFPKNLTYLVQLLRVLNIEKKYLGYKLAWYYAFDFHIINIIK